eukprot:2365076-Pleurochrysis_carterae.AAC.1
MQPVEQTVKSPRIRSQTPRLKADCLQLTLGLKRAPKGSTLKGHVGDALLEAKAVQSVEPAAKSLPMPLAINQAAGLVRFHARGSLKSCLKVVQNAAHYSSDKLSSQCLLH